MSFAASSGRASPAVPPRSGSSGGATATPGGASRVPLARAAAGVLVGAGGARPLSRTSSATASTFSSARKVAPPASPARSLHSAASFPSGLLSREAWAAALGAARPAAAAAVVASSPATTAGRPAAGTLPPTLGGSGGYGGALRVAVPQLATPGGACASGGSGGGGAGGERHRGSGGSGGSDGSLLLGFGAGAPLPSAAPSPALARTAAPALPAEALPRTPFALSDLEMLATVGTGTFGRVRLVHCQTARRHAALKIMKKSEVRERVRAGGTAAAGAAPPRCAAPAPH